MSGRTTDVEFWKSIFGNTTASWDDSYGGGSGYGTTYYDRGYSYTKPKRLHKFSPILLITNTVYNCEHCGAKKEDCKTEYCEEKNEDLNIGDWG